MTYKKVRNYNTRKKLYRPTDLMTIDAKFLNKIVPNPRAT